MSGPCTGVAGYTSRTEPNTYRLPTDVVSNAGPMDLSGKIAINVNNFLCKYERYCSGKNRNRVPLSEIALLILGYNVMTYIPQEIDRYERILDKVGNQKEVNIKWVRNLLYEGLTEQKTKERKMRFIPLGIGAMTESPSNSI